MKAKDDSKSKSDASVSSAVLLLPKHDLARFASYLKDLTASLSTRLPRESAISSLCQRDACAAVWGQIGTCRQNADITQAVIAVLEQLVSLASSGGVSGGGGAKEALSNLLSSGISLPGSMLERVITAEANAAASPLRTRLVAVQP